MRDVINAGLDPHRWFAAVMDKLIKPDLTHKDDPKWVAELKGYLKANVDDSRRQKAKMANFGRPPRPNQNCGIKRGTLIETIRTEGWKGFQSGAEHTGRGKTSHQPTRGRSNQYSHAG